MDQDLNFPISLGIPIASPFCKGGLRGISLIQSCLIEYLLKILMKVDCLAQNAFLLFNKKQDQPDTQMCINTCHQVIHDDAQTTPEFFRLFYGTGLKNIENPEQNKA